MYYMPQNISDILYARKVGLDNKQSQISKLELGDIAFAL